MGVKKRINRTERQREKGKQVGEVLIYKSYLHSEFKRTQHFYIYRLCTYLYVQHKIISWVCILPQVLRREY